MRRPGGASGPSQAPAVISSLSSITTPPPASIVTVLVTCSSVAGPSMTWVAVASPDGGTGFGSSGASSELLVIVTGTSPLFVTFHDTVV